MGSEAESTVLDVLFVMLERHAGGNLQRAVETLVQGQGRKVQQKIMSRVNFLGVGADEINAIYLSIQ